jgi:hypothetical protein
MALLSVTHWLTDSRSLFPSLSMPLAMLPWLASRVMRRQYEHAMHIHAKAVACLVSRKRGIHEAAAASRRKKMRLPTINREREFGRDDHEVHTLTAGCLVPFITRWLCAFKGLPSSIIFTN